MKLTNTNAGRITITVYSPVGSKEGPTPQFVYVIPAGESFDPIDVGFVVKQEINLEKELN